MFCFFSMTTWGPLEASPGLLVISGWHITYSKSNSETICKKIYGFSSKISVRKNIFVIENSQNLEISMIIFENQKIRKSKNRKIKNVNNLRYENFEIFRFLKKIMIENFDFEKIFFRPEFFDENSYFFLQIVSEFDFE